MLSALILHSFVFSFHTKSRIRMDSIGRFKRDHALLSAVLLSYFCVSVSHKDSNQNGFDRSARKRPLLAHFSINVVSTVSFLLLLLSLLSLMSINSALCVFLHLSCAKDI